MSVAHAASVPLGTGSITVTVTDDVAAPLPDALVCVSDATGSYARGRTDAAGAVTLPLASSAPGSVDLVVTSPDFRPHEGAFAIDPIAGPNLALSMHAFDDAAGNGDGVVDAGESIALDVTAFNGGGASADAATVTASGIEPCAVSRITGKVGSSC